MVKLRKTDKVKIQIEIITGSDEIACILSTCYRENNAIVVTEKIPRVRFDKPPMNFFYWNLPISF